MKYLIVIAGPTAVGKTSVAIQLAEKLGAEIISADSRQIYRELNIGVAKPNLSEQEQVTHHFISHTSIAEVYSVGKYEREVMSFLTNYFKSNDIIVCTGGTGLYIDALRFGLDAFPEVSADYRIKYEDLFRDQGIIELQDRLKKEDPDYFQEVDVNNSARLIRALSVCDATGKTFSSFRRKKDIKRPFKIIPIVLTRPRKELYDRINQRVDQMINDGLENEVKELLPYRHLETLKTVGYQEFLPYFDGDISIIDAIDKIKQKSRNYAKRQMTWFRKHGDWVEFGAEDLNIYEFITNKITS